MPGFRAATAFWRYWSPSQGDVFGAVLGTGDTVAALAIEFVLTVTMLGIAYATAIPLGWPV